MTWDVVFLPCRNNYELEQSPAGGVFEPVRGTPVRNVPKRGKIVPKGVLPKKYGVVETAGYTLAQAFQKGVLGHTPLLITLVHPLYTRERKKKSA